MSGGFSNKGPTGSSGLTAAETLWVQSGNGGILLLTEQSSAPSATANVGKVYTKSSDSLLYFKTDGGVEYLISGGGSGHTIQDEGTPLTARTNLNFVGAGVTVTDGGAGPNSTIVTVTGGGDVVGPASATDNAIVRFDLTTGKLIQNSTVTIGDTGAIVNTIADTSNVVALTITQNDITNNPRGIVVTNAGTGQAIRVVANGNTGTSASTSGAIFLDNTNNIGTGGNFYTNGATVGTTGVLFAKVDNAAASGPVVRIDNDGTGNALKINANGNVGTSFSGSGALLIDNTLNTGFGLNVYSNVGAAAGPLARIYAANALFDQPTLQITNNGTSGAAASIRIDGVSPQIEMVEDDQVTPAGKYELQVQGDRFFINGRNSADTSFETIVIVDRVGNSNTGRTSFAGPIAPITTDGAAIGTTSLMWSDLFLASGAVINFNAGNATLTHSASLLTSSVDIVVPAEVYGVAWNGSNEAPTKNDVYDKIETISVGTPSLLRTFSLMGC